MGSRPPLDLASHGPTYSSWTAGLEWSLDWLLDSKEAVGKVREVLPKIQAQLADEKGNSRFVKVNEDLRRLATRLEKT